jgi:hypothetical protein
MDAITFVLEFCTCDEADNTQSGDCTDYGPLPSEGPVRVTCADMDDNLLFSENVEQGDEITMEGGMPDEMICSVFTPAGELLQTVVINTSGTVNLFLTDKFGSLTMVACDANDMVQDCIQEITFTYEVCSSGSTALEVSTMNSEFNGVSNDLLPQIDDLVIPPGECMVVQETQTINICEQTCFNNTMIMVDTTTSCGAEDTFDFCLLTPSPTPGPTGKPNPFSNSLTISCTYYTNPPTSRSYSFAHS